MDCYSSSRSDQQQIDPYQPMLLVSMIPPQLRITMHDYLYPKCLSYSMDDPSFYDYHYINETTLETKSVTLKNHMEHLRITQQTEVHSTMKAFIIPQLALVLPLRFMIWKTLNLLPSILNYLKHVHKIDEFIQYLQSPPQVNITYHQLLEAFTAKDLWQSFNYDIYETYGDSWIK